MNQQKSRPLAASKPHAAPTQELNPAPKLSIEPTPAPAAPPAPAPETPPLAKGQEFLTALQKRNQRYLRIDWALTKSNELLCSSPAVHTLTFMATYADFATGWVAIPPKEIRQQTSLTEHLLRQSLKELVTLGLLEQQGRRPTAWGNAPQYRFPAADHSWGLTDPTETDNTAPPEQPGFLPVEYAAVSPEQIDMFQSLLEEAGLTWEQAKPRLKTLGVDYTGLELEELPRRMNNQFFKALKQLKRQAGRRDANAASMTAPQSQPELTPKKTLDLTPVSGDPDPAAQELWKRILAHVKAEIPSHAYQINFPGTEGHALTPGQLLISTADPLDGYELKRDYLPMLQQADLVLHGNYTLKFKFQPRPNPNLLAEYARALANNEIPL